MRVEGLDELISILKDLEINIPYALADAGYTSMVSNVETVAKERCPVDTGMLKASIHTEILEETPTKVHIQTGTNVSYGYFVEYGTGIYNVHGDGRQTPWKYFYRGHKGQKGYRKTQGQKPQPYLTTAFEMTQNRIPVTIAERLQEMIKKEVLKRYNTRE
jgi:HK97 gp10 family phage protein